MALKQYRPMTNAQRQLVLIDRSGLHKGAPVKALTEGQHKHGGRNNTGRVTVRWQGGGHKQRYRLIDFKRRKFDMPAVVERLEYDPNRTSFIALLKYKDGELAYILAPQRLAVGDTVISGDKVDVKPGNDAALGHPGRHHRPQHRDEAGQGRPDRPLRRCLRAVSRPRRRLRADAPQFVGSAPRAAGLHGHHRRGVEPGPHERSHRQGRPQRLEGQAPLRARQPP